MLMCSVTSVLDSYCSIVHTYIHTLWYSRARWIYFVLRTMHTNWVPTGHTKWHCTIYLNNGHSQIVHLFLCISDKDWHNRWNL